MKKKPEITSQVENLVENLHIYGFDIHKGHECATTIIQVLHILCKYLFFFS